MDLTSFAAEVGSEGPVTITGLGTRGGAVPGVRTVHAPSGIEWVQPDEMTVAVGAGTPVDELAAALAEVGQRTVLPPGGTVGGALAVGRSGVRRLGDGPLRDCLLQADVVAADGQVVRAGGPTVKNVTGFDLCRLLVGSHGRLAFLAAVILRTIPIAPYSAWWTAPTTDPSTLFTRLHRPVSVLWDGAAVWVLLEGHPVDVTGEAASLGLVEADGPPDLPTGSRRIVPPADVVHQRGRFVAEVGVGIVHHADPAPPRPPTPRTLADLERRIERHFDPTGRLNPGVVVG